MKVLVLGATGGTGRLIVRFRPGERPFRRALVRSKASADLPGVDMMFVTRASSPVLLQ